MTSVHAIASRPAVVAPRASRGRVLLWLAVLLGGALALLFWMPAAWLTGVVGSATGGRLVLDEPRGTVWSGSARLLLTGGEGSRDAAALPGRVEWVLRPVWLGAALDVRLPCCSGNAVQVTALHDWDATQVTVGPAQLRLPMGLLTGLGTPWNTVQLQGVLAIDTAGMDVRWQQRQLAPRGEVRMEATDVASRLSTLRPLGSYRMALAAPGGNASPTLQLDTLAGSSLLLSGRGEWAGGRLRFTGEASAVPGREAALANLLNIIGRRNGPRSIITVG